MPNKKSKKKQRSQQQRAVTEAEKTEARRLRAEGKSYRAIARELGRAKSTVTNWIDPVAREKALAASRAWQMANPEKMFLRHKERQQWLDQHRREHGCKDCGTSDGLLHLDHRDGEEKLFNPAVRTRGSWERLKAEVAKCDVRCASCHAKRHARVRRQELVNA